MHQDIADCLNTFYQNKLYFGSERQKTPFNFYGGNLDNPLAESLSKSRLIFINSEKSKFSKTHPIEVQQVAEITSLIAQIKGEELNATSIGIISPWRAQVAMIKNALSPELRELVMVDTVERFQGSERDFIIVSFALSNHLQLGAMQSLNHYQTLDRKLLVTLSRAKEQVIFIGNEAILKRSNIYEEVLAKFIEINFALKL
jgi:DNA replication ATP-dependent helicase Dna2